MPTALRVGRYRFFFFSNEGREPPHIHAEADDREAKFWLDPIELAANNGFKAHELNGIRAIIEEHHNDLLEDWHEHFGTENA